MLETGTDAMQELGTKLALAMFAGLLVMATTLGFFAPTGPTPEERAAASRQHVEEHLRSQLYPHAASLPPGVRFVETRCDCGRDTEDWAMITVPPGEVERLRRAIVQRYLRHERQPLTTTSLLLTDGALLGDRASNRPAWWTPTKLPDAEAVALDHFGGFVIVFSAKTGTIFIMSWTV